MDTSAPSHETRNDAANSNTKQSSPSMVKGASLLIILQLISRLITFIANQLLLRFLTAPLLGISAQLEVYYLSILFFARESLRVAIQRQGIAEDDNAAAASEPPAKSSRNDGDAQRRESQAVVNLGYLSLALGSLVSIALGWTYLAYLPLATLEATPHLVESLWLYGIAAMVELASEPCFVLMQVRLRFSTRAAAESLATLLRCAVTFASAAWALSRRVDAGVLPLALGQLSYGASLLLVYLYSGQRLAAATGFSLLPKPLSRPSSAFLLSYFYAPTVTLAASMVAQSIVKHLLTQGDTLIISLLAAPEAQGVYALANNYGSLLARLLFQPLEESSRSYFSRLLSPAASTTTSTRPASTAIQTARQNLYTLLRSYILLSAIIVGLGPFAAPPLLSIVAGQRWAGSGAAEVLATYCFYIPFMALNGITESFVASVASEADVHSQSGWMGAFSLVFAAAAFLFMRVMSLGAHGLVYANSINMLCRIVWSVTFISRFFNQHGLDFSLASLIPKATVTASISTFILLHSLDLVRDSYTRPLATLIRIAGSALPFISLIAFLERRFLLECFHSIRGPKAAKH